MNSSKPVWPLAIVGSAIVLFQPDTFIHESGHAIACCLQGDRVTFWQPLVPASAQTACTHQNTALFTAGGTFTSVLVWAICTIFFAVWLSQRSRHTPLSGWISTWWLWWSFVCLGELVLWALQVHEQPPHDDSARFIAATGTNPKVVIETSLALFFTPAIGLFIPTAWKMWQALPFSPSPQSEGLHHVDHRHGVDGRESCC